jgi:hypothetical protein
MNDADNPYLPPRTAVADPVVGDLGSRPIAINVALLLIAAKALLGLGVLVNFPFGMPVTQLLVGLMPAVISIAFAIMLGWFIARGRNWARILYLVLTILSLLWLAMAIGSQFAQPAGVTMRSSISLWSVMTTFVPRALSIAVVVLLFGPGRAWFRDRRADLT